jgi:hypothetical protein
LTLYYRLKDRSFGSVFWSQAKSVTSVNSKIKEARWKTAKQLEDVFGPEAEEMKKVLPRHFNGSHHHLMQQVGHFDVFLTLQL